ncbi:MAG: 50S ribosomal protein L25 [Chloroflexi bacterium]|nr:50S ribosomal protein L25 [Chloroflexota bacterium]MCL5950457.1 50S ribosomal protein L25 [Chloroflexota bacterium]
MPDEIVLTAEPRTVIGKQVSALRRAGSVPAILYGTHLESPIPLKIDEKTLKLVIAKAGHNRLIRLTLDSGAPRLVLAREVQRNPITWRIVHVDLQEVSMTEKITTEVPLSLVGTSPAVSRGEGLLIHGIDAVQIRALANELITVIEVDVSSLNDLNQSLFVSDLKVGENIEILTPRDEMVAKVVPVKEEVITEAVPAAAAEVEVIGKGKKEEEVPEGAEAPAGGEAKKEEKK